MERFGGTTPRRLRSSSSGRTGDGSDEHGRRVSGQCARLRRARCSDARLLRQGTIARNSQEVADHGRFRRKARALGRLTWWPRHSAPFAYLRPRQPLPPARLELHLCRLQRGHAVRTDIPTLRSSNRLFPKGGHGWRGSPRRLAVPGQKLREYEPDGKKTTDKREGDREKDYNDEFAAHHRIAWSFEVTPALFGTLRALSAH
jgi:hypothetical protein